MKIANFFFILGVFLFSLGVQATNDNFHRDEHGAFLIPLQAESDADLLPPTPITAQTVVESIRESHQWIEGWLVQRFKWYQNDIYYDRCKKPAQSRDCGINKKLFEGSTSVFDVLPTVRFETPYNKTCFDYAGRATDASLNGQISGTWCVSVKKILELPGIDSFQAQTGGLIVALLALKLDATRDEAISLQKAFYNSLKRITPWTIQQNTYAVYNGLQNISFRLAELPRLTDQYGTLDETCRKSKEIFELYTDLYNRMNTDMFFPMSRDSEGYFWGSYVSVQATHKYLCGLDRTEPPEDRSRNATIYKNLFNGNSTIRARDTVLNFSFLASPDVILKKIEYPWDLPENFEGLVALANDVKNKHGAFRMRMFSTYISDSSGGDKL